MTSAFELAMRAVEAEANQERGQGVRQRTALDFFNLYADKDDAPHDMTRAAAEMMIDEAREEAAARKKGAERRRCCTVFRASRTCISRTPPTRRWSPIDE